MTGLRAPACSLSEVVFDLNPRLRAQPKAAHATRDRAGRADPAKCSLKNKGRGGWEPEKLGVQPQGERSVAVVVVLVRNNTATLRLLSGSISKGARIQRGP